MMSYVAPLLLVIAWIVWSFLFWRSLRDMAVGEDKIFHMMFFSTLLGIIAARLMFVVTHWHLFSETILRIFTIWIEPGMSVIPMLMTVVALLMTQSRMFGIPRSYTLDAFAKAFGVAYVIGSIGTLMSGQTVGKLTNLPFAIHYATAGGLRHPVQLYEALFIIAVLLLLHVIFVHRKPVPSRRNGMYGVWFFLLFSLGLFFIEMLKDNSVYWGKLSTNQWMLVAIGSETTGVLFVWGHAGKYIKAFAGRIYESISKRFNRNHQSTT